MASKIGDKKQALLAHKEELLREIEYYEKRIEDARDVQQHTSFYENDSSDSEQEFSIDIGPNITELKLQQSMLETCLQATQELTNVQILQSEVNVMVDNPVFDGEPQITEEGTWREVIVECRVDLVPFSMSFYYHQPNRLFAPLSFRNLHVLLVKTAHEQELSKSILSSVRTPSDAVEVVRSYAQAHRSRRSSLARLAERYEARLHMEPATEGGYLLKCANVLEVSWTLQNKWSPIAPFHHKMKFELEYMDESYIKIIAQAHRQLSDPAIDTDERTLLMAKIINTCLEAETANQDHHESSEVDSIRSKRQTLDGEQEKVGKSKDSEIMAPPKTLPKKIKPKGKENTVSNAKKRPNDSVHNDNVKKSKVDDVSQSENSEGTSKFDNEVNNAKKVQSKTNVASSKVESKKTVNAASSKNVTDANTVKNATVKNTETSKNITQSKGKLTNKPGHTDNTKSKTVDKKTVNAASSKNDKNTLAKNTETSNKDNDIITQSKGKLTNKPTTTYNAKSKTVDKKTSEALTTDKEKNAQTKNNKENNTNHEVSKKTNSNLAATDKEKDTQTKTNKENNSNPNQNREKNKQLHLSERFKKNVAINKNNIASGVKLKNLNNLEKKKISIGNKIVSQRNVENKSKIPQKRLTDPIKKNPLRISPRKPQTSSSRDTSKNSVQTVTNIPRLVKKPTTKPKT